MWGVSIRNELSRKDLYGRLGLEKAAYVVRQDRQRWFGHVERKGNDDWVSACRSFGVAGVKSRGRGEETWNECVRQDMDLLGLRKKWVHRIELSGKA